MNTDIEWLFRRLLEIDSQIHATVLLMYKNLNGAKKRTILAYLLGVAHGFNAKDARARYNAIMEARALLRELIHDKDEKKGKRK